MAIQASKTCKVWIQVCAIVAVSGILGDILYFLLVFFDKVFLKWFCCFSSIAFSPFYRVNLGSQGTIDSPVLLPVYQSLFCAHRPEGWAFRCFSFFLPFDVVSSKAMVEFSIPKCAWCHVPYGSTFGRPSFFVIFPEWAESNSVSSKVFCYYFLFYSSLFWFPKVPFLCIVRGYSRLSPFSCWISDTWEGRICPLFLVFLGVFI